MADADSFPGPHRRASSLRCGRHRPHRVMLSMTTPEVLLRRVATELDRAAFEELFRHFAPRIKAYLMRSGAAPQAAEDLAQEAMLAVWRKAKMFDPAKASAATWVFTVARNLRIDSLRRERLRGYDPNDPTFAPDDPVKSDHALNAREDSETLRRALHELPAEQAEIVTLSFLSDKPHSEIAAELGIPLGTVKSRIRLAMQRLRVLLGDQP